MSCAEGNKSVELLLGAANGIERLTLCPREAAAFRDGSGASWNLCRVYEIAHPSFSNSYALMRMLVILKGDHQWESLSPYRQDYRPRHRYSCLDETAAATGLSKTSVTNAGAFSSIAQTQSSLLYLRTATGRER